MKHRQSRSIISRGQDNRWLADHGRNTKQCFAIVIFLTGAYHKDASTYHICISALALNHAFQSTCKTWSFMQVSSSQLLTSSNRFKQVPLAWTLNWTFCSVQPDPWTLNWTSVQFWKVQVRTSVQNWTVAALLVINNTVCYEVHRQILGQLLLGNKHSHLSDSLL